jgi:hypothetical protein
MGAGRDDNGSWDRDAGMQTLVSQQAVVATPGGSPRRRGSKQEADVERTDWLEEGFDSAQAQFLMVTAITHHRVSSPLWGEDEVRKLQAELAEIASAAAQLTTSKSSAELHVSRLFS